MDCWLSEINELHRNSQENLNKSLFTLCATLCDQPIALGLFSWMPRRPILPLVRILGAWGTGQRLGYQVPIYHQVMVMPFSWVTALFLPQSWLLFLSPFCWRHLQSRKDTLKNKGEYTFAFSIRILLLCCCYGQQSVSTRREQKTGTWRKGNEKWRDASLFHRSRCIILIEYKMFWPIGFVYFKEVWNIFSLFQIGIVKNNWMYFRRIYGYYYYYYYYYLISRLLWNVVQGSYLWEVAVQEGQVQAVVCIVPLGS